MNRRTILLFSTLILILALTGCYGGHSSDSGLVKLAVKITADYSSLNHDLPEGILENILNELEVASTQEMEEKLLEHLIPPNLAESYEKGTIVEFETAFRDNYRHKILGAFFRHGASEYNHIGFDWDGQKGLDYLGDDRDQDGIEFMKWSVLANKDKTVEIRFLTFEAGCG